MGTKDRTAGVSLISILYLFLLSSSLHLLSWPYDKNTPAYAGRVKRFLGKHYRLRDLEGHI